MSAAVRWVSVGLASGLFLSYLPAYFLRGRRLTGAGLIGSTWGLILIPWLPFDPVRQIAVWAGVLALSIVISDIAETALASHDDPRIVIDEFIGFWTALLFLPRTPLMLVLGFVFFRIFDVLKPGIVRRSGHLPGGWGIVTDDVLAGVAANAILQVIARVVPV